MKKLSWIFVVMLGLLLPVLQSCDNDDEVCYTANYTWDWATVSTTEGGDYFLQGDRWGVIEPVATSQWKDGLVKGNRVMTVFHPLVKTEGGVEAALRVLQPILTKGVEEMTASNEKDFGDDPVVIYQGDMWLGGNFLNIIFQQNLPAREKHRISLVQNKIEGTEGAAAIDKDGYVHLELRYNTYGDVTQQWHPGRVSFDLNPFFAAAKSSANTSAHSAPQATPEATPLKGFKVTIHSKENGKGVVVVLDLKKPVGVPQKAGAEVPAVASIQ